MDIKIDEMHCQDALGIEYDMSDAVQLCWVLLTLLSSLDHFAGFVSVLCVRLNWQDSPTPVIDVEALGRAQRPTSDVGRLLKTQSFNST